MIEKLIYEAKEMMAESKKAENEAEAAYELVIADTNDSVAALMRSIAEKPQVKADATKDLEQTKSDLDDSIKELQGLAKYNAELHAECDYILKNFHDRQEARGQEIEALQQAK